MSCSSPEVPSTVSPGPILHTSKDVPSPVPPTHHLWPGPQTRLLLHTLFAAKVAGCAHTSIGLSKRPPEAATLYNPALLRCFDWPAEERCPRGSVCQHTPHACYCAKYWTGERGRGWCKGEEGGGDDSVVCWQVRPWTPLFTPL